MLENKRLRLLLSPLELNPTVGLSSRSRYSNYTGENSYVQEQSPKIKTIKPKMPPLHDGHR